MNTFLIQLSVYGRSRSILLISIVSVLMVVGIPVYIGVFEDYLPGQFKALFAGTFEFPLVYNTVSNLLYYFSYVFGILVILITCQGFEYNTYKLQVINGVSKVSLWKNSVYLCLLISVILFGLCAALSMVVGMANDPENFTFNGMEWVFLCAAQSFVLVCYAVSVSLVFKRSGTAIFVYFVWFALMERTLAQILDFNFHLYPLFRFLPGKVVEDLSYLIATQDKIILHREYFEIKPFIAAIWLLVSLGFNFYRFKTEDYVK